MPRNQPSRVQNHQPQQQTGAFLAARHIEVNSRLLPSPKELREYDAALPGAAERIIAMAELEQAERHRAQAYALETLRIDNIAERNAEKRGQWMATVFIWGNLLSAVGLAVFNLTVPACILGIGSLSAVLIALINGKKK